MPELLAEAARSNGSESRRAKSRACLRAGALSDRRWGISTSSGERKNSLACARRLPSPTDEPSSLPLGRDPMLRGIIAALVNVAATTKMANEKRMVVCVV